VELISDADMVRLHPTGAHPESGERLRVLHQHFGEWREAVPGTREDIERCHDSALVDLVRGIKTTTFLDPDTVCSETSYEAALLAAGGAIEALGVRPLDNEGLKGSGTRESPAGGEKPHRSMGSDPKPGGFALVRPPGHHATRSHAMGFCLFNNIAIAARYAQAELGLERVAIVDWDVHHGNGTEDIFRNDPSVLFVSLHQWPFYPGTGGPEEQGETLMNIPLPAGSTDEDYLRACTQRVEPAVAAFEPDLVLVSAGFDAHEEDPLAGMLVTEAGFRELAGRSAALGPKMAAVLEGGYNLETLPRLVTAALEGFSA
jgi:acetoin utilization deacetylase AcuC-like enzyme